MFKVYYFNEVTSTMDVIKLYPINSVIVAKKQNSGRGKQNRTWISNESENLYMSLSLGLDSSRNGHASFVFLTALALVKTLEKLAQDKLDIKIKWPNDILINSKKVCGILVEVDSQKNLIIIGIGLNIDSYPELVDNILFKATSLAAEGFLVKRDIVVDEFLRVFRSYTNSLSTYGFSGIREEWLKYAYNFGKTIAVKTNSTQITGIFEDLDLTGSLVLSRDREKIYISSGDVF
jgi:BirA family biotin operon repressor/biotin-[acetyl-CoA-carboxylase] ligase